jgi:acetyl esterase/lipase
MLSRMTIAESRYIDAPAADKYRQLCKSKGEEVKILRVKVLDGEVPAYWVGSPDAEVVMLYFHGGGYTLACVPAHLEYVHTLVKNLNGNGRSKSFAVLFVGYSLAPEATHPTPLREAAAVLSYLVGERGKSPSDILISGDSAGGGLTFSLLSHLLHPHPQVPEVSLSKPLRGVLAYSPWVDFKTDHDSYDRNAQKDVLTRRCLHVWSAMYTGKSTGNPQEDPGCCLGSDPYVDPASNDSTWWNGLHRVVGDIFIWVGGDEVFVDGVAAFHKTLREGWTQGGGVGERVQYMEPRDEAHIQPIVDWKEEGKVTSDSQIAIEAWLKDRIG